MLEQSFEMTGQSWCAVWIAQFINNHRRAKRPLQEGLCDAGVGINPGGINRSDARARDRRNGEPPVLTAGRKQLHGVAEAGLKDLRQTRTNDNRAGVVSKIVKAALDQLMEKIGRLRMKSGFDSIKIDSRIFKPGACAQCSAQDRRTRNDIGELPAYPHDFICVSDPLEIRAAPRLAV